MKSLYSSINNFLHNWKDFSSASDKITSPDIKFPVQISGTHGSLFTYFLSDLCNTVKYKKLQFLQYNNSSKKTPDYKDFSQDYLIVVPGEYEMNNLSEDIQTIFPQAQVYLFPSWGTIPYRAAAPGSLVFGQRAGFLSKLLEEEPFTSELNPRIFIITQRSFMSPLPPPDYTRGFSFTLKKKDSIDTVKIAQKLTQIGYTRVSRVNVRGEFSLRGEVLDIFLPLEENPVRLVFDFDTIESLKEFETDSQITLKTREKITICPVKEVLWDDGLVEKLRQKLDDYHKNALQNEHVHLPFTQHALEYKEMLLEELAAKKAAEGEEFYYSLLWDQTYSILDYINPNSFVLFYDYDRLLNAELAINREFTGMYRKTKETLPVLPPDMMLYPLSLMLEKVSNSLYFKTVLDQNDQELTQISL